MSSSTGEVRDRRADEVITWRHYDLSCLEICSALGIERPIRSDIEMTFISATASEPDKVRITVRTSERRTSP